MNIKSDYLNYRKNYFALRKMRNLNFGKIVPPELAVKHVHMPFVSHRNDIYVDKLVFFRLTVENILRTTRSISELEYNKDFSLYTSITTPNLFESTIFASEKTNDMRNFFLRDEPELQWKPLAFEKSILSQVNVRNMQHFSIIHCFSVIIREDDYVEDSEICFLQPK